MKKALSLLAWLVVYVPTSAFVIFVLIKAYFEQRRGRKAERQGVAWV